MAESRGMNIVRSDDGSILFRVVLFDASDVKVTTGSTDLRVWRIQPTTGALETFDFSDDTFKVGPIVTATLAMTHRTAENDSRRGCYGSRRRFQRWRSDRCRGDGYRRTNQQCESQRSPWSR